jgi:hypothetical protein
MAASDAGAIVLGAAIGAGSAIVTQVIALIAESKRERKRVQREQERFDRELELRRDERFLDIKQDLYSRLGLLASELINYTYYPIDSLAMPQLEAVSLPDLQEMKRLQSNIDMIVDKNRSRDINLAIIKLIGASATTHRDDVPQGDKTREADAARARWWSAQAGMRRDLSGDKEYFKRSKAMVPLSPDPPPARFLPSWRYPIRSVKKFLRKWSA